MTKFKQIVQGLIQEEDGATMPEYALMLALIAVVCIIAVQAVGTNALGVFNESATALGDAT